ncbi:MAG: hypothetical protein IJU05_01360 [Schwartzia sp.]|nr:hypothetical protein [Schwartzia sp. (in: firmicutes)]
MELVKGCLPGGSEIDESMFGTVTLSISEGLLKSRKIKLNDHLVAAERLTEENKHSLLGKAGWGTLGALVLGPVGLLAGLVLGGNSKEICCACKLDTGEAFLVTCTVDEYKKLWTMAKPRMENPPDKPDLPENLA